MLSNIILIVSFLPVAFSTNFWNLPTNVKFSIDYYNSTNCISNFSNTTELIFYCPANDNSDNCCNMQLNKLAPISNPVFNVCYDIVTNMTDVFAKYSCTDVGIQDLSTVEIFAFIGICLLAVLFLMLICLFAKLLCCSDKRYHKM